MTQVALSKNEIYIFKHSLWLLMVLLLLWMSLGNYTCHSHVGQPSAVVLGGVAKQSCIDILDKVHTTFRDLISSSTLNGVCEGERVCVCMHVYV